MKRGKGGMGGKGMKRDKNKRGRKKKKAFFSWNRNQNDAFFGKNFLEPS